MEGVGDKQMLAFHTAAANATPGFDVEEAAKHSHIAIVAIVILQRRQIISYSLPDYACLPRGCRLFSSELSRRVRYSVATATLR